MNKTKYRENKWENNKCKWYGNIRKAIKVRDKVIYSGNAEKQLK